MEHTLQDLRVTTAKKRTIRRVGLACVQCRMRKVRCDATEPACNRCLADAKECEYQKSRRGGRPRRCVTATATTTASLQATQEAPASPDQRNMSTNSNSSIGISGSVLGDASNIETEFLAELISPAAELHSPRTVTDQLLSQYYKFFHVAHPCVLPRWSLQLRLATESVASEVLLPVLLYIGSIFTDTIDSAPLSAAAAQAISSARTQPGPTSPYYIQALNLYAIVVYWCDDRGRGRELLDEAIREALALDMHKADFASQHGQGDPVLEESWRRTWWQIYLTDAHIAGSIHSYPTQTGAVQITTHLPCEEQQYESGRIPTTPATLRSYAMREFSDVAFSSFAQLVGFTHGINRALVTRRINDIENAKVIAKNADIFMTAWYSLLPLSQRSVLRDDGSVDELLFTANILMHTYIVDLHRQLSNLKYFTIESVSKCVPPPPPDCNDSIRDEAHIHTAKAFSSFEKLNAFLTLPTCFSEHTPFLICMITVITVAHLSACCHIFTEPQLALEREKIRLNMGMLKMLGNVWPAGRNEYRRVGIIAREVLSLEEEEVSRSEPMSVMPTGAMDSVFDFDFNWTDDTFATDGAWEVTSSLIT